MFQTKKIVFAKRQSWLFKKVKHCLHLLLQISAEDLNILLLQLCTKGLTSKHCTSFWNQISTHSRILKKSSSKFKMTSIIHLNLELLTSLCAARLRLQGDYIAPSRHAFNFLLADQTFLELTVNSYKHFSALRYDPNLLLLLQDAEHHHKIDTTERSSRFICSYTHLQKPKG